LSAIRPDGDIDFNRISPYLLNRFRDPSGMIDYNKLREEARNYISSNGIPIPSTQFVSNIDPTTLQPREDFKDQSNFDVTTTDRVNEDLPEKKEEKKIYIDPVQLARQKEENK